MSDRPGHALLAAELEPGEPGTVALRLLDEVLAGRPERDGPRFSACARHLCALRRNLVGALHAQEDEVVRRRLGRLNGVISVVVGGHFPLGKVPWEHLEHARMALAEVVADEGQGSALDPPGGSASWTSAGD